MSALSHSGPSCAASSLPRPRIQGLAFLLISYECDPSAIRAYPTQCSPLSPHGLTVVLTLHRAPLCPSATPCAQGVPLAPRLINDSILLLDPPPTLRSTPPTLIHWTHYLHPTPWPWAPLWVNCGTNSFSLDPPLAPSLLPWTPPLPTGSASVILRSAPLRLQRL